MLKPIEGLGASVVAFEAHGVVTGDDYASTLVPAVEAAIDSGVRPRLLYVLGHDFERFDTGAMLADTKVGMGHLADFERIAVVTDVEWVDHAVRAFGVVIPCPVKVFRCVQRKAAETWISEPVATALEVHAERVGDTAQLYVRLHGALGQATEQDLIDTATQGVGDAQHVRLLLEAEDFHGWNDVRALWQHVRFVAGMQRKLDRVAIVGDASWQARMVAIARHVMRVDARFFPEVEKEAARAWIRG